MALVKGVAYWASITTPNTNFEPVYTVNLVVDDAIAKDFEERGFSVKEKEEGPTLVFKRKVKNKNGGDNKVPVLIDKFKNPIDVQVGNGSEVVVQYEEWESNYKGKEFKGLDLKGVQVLSLVEYGAPDGSEFEAFESDDAEEFV